MQWVGLGKITVVSAGTPVPLSATKLMVNKVIITYDASDVGATIYIKDPSGNQIANMTMPATSTSFPSPLELSSPGANQIDLSALFVDSSVSGKGPVVGYALN